MMLGRQQQPGGLSFSQILAEIHARETDPVVIGITDPGSTAASFSAAASTSGLPIFSRASS